MEKEIRSRRCHKCRRIVVRFIPDRVILGIMFSTCETVRPHRSIREPGEKYYHYYCLDCLHKLYPDRY